MSMPESRTEFLDPHQKLVGQLAERLASRVKTDPAGAASLAHLLVIVPTAQSGRRLRLALARRFPQGLVPPLVRMPAHLAQPSDDTPIAGRVDELIAFWEAGGRKQGLDVAAQYADIRAVLGANALSFADVAGRVGSILAGNEAVDLEVARWQELAELEKRYLDALAARGKTDRIAATRAAVERPSVPADVEEVVLACVLDPLPVMRQALANLGLPVTELVPSPVEGAMPLRDGQIRAYGTAAEESERLAEFLGAVKSDEALPALCLADAEMFPDLKGALQARGLKVHNPSSTRLATSSLGRLAAQVAALARTRSYSVFSSFIRGGDVRRWLMSELGLTVETYTAALNDLDNRQAEFLPEKMDDIGPKLHGRIRLIYDFISQRLARKGVREILQVIFNGYLLDERDADAREFAAAAEVMNGLLDECFDPSVPAQLAMELFARRLDEAVYSLEPDEGEVILTDGWLELPYLEADELLIVGFEEGCVPESIVGHAFLPDALRRGLGLQDNASRAARDRIILAQALACRPAAAVRISFHNLDAAGNVCKPSRLLFETADDRELAARVKRLYGLRAGTGEGRAPDLPFAWRLKLPVPPEHEELEKLSPTALDRYLRCPFTYFLARKDILGDKRMDDRAQELESWEFGNFAHAALEAWALSPLKDSEDPAAIAAFLEERIDAQLVERFGTAIPSIVALQGESLKRRLRHFAPVQAARHAAGWQVVAAEKKLEVVYGHTRFAGKCDRFDYNPTTDEWCVIDYKTWDTADRAESYDEKKKAWKSLQLPLYCAMLDALDEEPFASAHLERISSCYCILGKTADDVCFSKPMSGALVPDAERLVRELVDRIEQGVFWPPSPKREWQWDYLDWLSPSPEETVDADWIADQERRVAAAAEAQAAEGEEEVRS